MYIMKKVWKIVKIMNHLARNFYTCFNRNLCGLLNYIYGGYYYV